MSDASKELNTLEGPSLLANHGNAVDLFAPTVPAALTRPRNRILVIAFMVAVGIGAMVFGPALDTPAGAQDSGSGLFEQYCASCHQADGTGIPGTFPPLAGNPAAADSDQVTDAITGGVSGPIEVLGVSYDGVMPGFSDLSGDEVAAIVEYVAVLSGSGQQATPSKEQATPSEDQAAGGDSARGQKLFEGAIRFENGGAACGACHSAGVVGNLGGRGLGPDLTSSSDTLGGEAGLTGWLGNPPSVTMQPIFADRPLTSDEVADVVAFLGETSAAGNPPGGIDRLTIAGLVGFFLLIGGMAVAWRGMRQPYSSRLRSKR